MAKLDQKDVELQTWPSFVDILSSTVLVLTFALLVLVVIVAISSQQKGGSTVARDGGKADLPVTLSNTLTTQKNVSPALPVISQSASQATDVQTQRADTKFFNNPQYVTERAKVNSDIQVRKVGKSNKFKQAKKVLPEVIPSTDLNVLKELVMVQQDVIEEQRKAIEQKNKVVEVTSKEYQSLLSIVLKDTEVEDLKQKMYKKDNQAKFKNLDIEGEELSGDAAVINGNGSYISNPNVSDKDPILTNLGNNKYKVQWVTPSERLSKKFVDDFTKMLSSSLTVYNNGKVKLSVTTGTSVTDVEARRVSIGRLVIIRRLLVDLGLKPENIEFVNNNKDISREDNIGYITIEPKQE